jgi:hypothetical protein
VTVKLGLEGAEAAAQSSVSRARTVAPDTSGITTYSLSFTPTGGGTAKSQDVTGTSADVELAVGTYSLKVTAKKDTTEVAEGTATGIGISSEPATAAVILGPKTGGANGTFRYSVGTPAGASGNLVITTSTGGTVTDGTKTLNADTTNTDTVPLAPGYYRLAVSLTKGGETAALSNEAIHIYSGLESAFERVFTDAHFEAAAAAQGALGLTISLGNEEIEIEEAGALSFVQGAAATFTLTVADTDFTNIKWYLDEEQDNPVETGASYTPSNDLAVKTHFVTVTAEKNGRTYSEIVEFTVTAAGSEPAPLTVGPVDANGLGVLLTSAAVSVGTPETPTIVKLDSTVDVTSNIWGTTVKDALTGVEKYITLDLSACTSGVEKKIMGTWQHKDNDFNTVMTDYVVGVILPNDLVEISDSAFDSWTSLRYVTISPNLTIISYNAFLNTENLKSIIIPNSVTTIRSGAFQDSGLESITIPASVIGPIEVGTFSPCPYLMEVAFESNTMTFETDPFEGNLDTVYSGAGTYTKTGGSGDTSTWTKN